MSQNEKFEALAREVDAWTKDIQDDLDANKHNNAMFGMDKRQEILDENPGLQEYMIEKQKTEASKEMSSIVPEGLSTDVIASGSVEGDVTPMSVGGQAQSAERTV